MPGFPARRTADRPESARSLLARGELALHSLRVRFATRVEVADKHWEGPMERESDRRTSQIFLVDRKLLGLTDREKAEHWEEEDAGFFVFAEVRGSAYRIRRIARLRRQDWEKRVS
jgi:hypothetical protein